MIDKKEQVTNLIAPVKVAEAAPLNPVLASVGLRREKFNWQRWGVSLLTPFLSLLVAFTVVA
jgi:hypothetical protein